MSAIPEINALVSRIGVPATMDAMRRWMSDINQEAAATKANILRTPYVRLQTIMLDAARRAELEPSVEAIVALRAAIVAFQAAGGAGDNLSYCEVVLNEVASQLR